MITLGQESSAIVGSPSVSYSTIYADSTSHRLTTVDSTPTTVTYMGVTTTDAQITNKDFADGSTTISDVSATSKAIKFSLSGMTAGQVLTVASSQASSQTLTIPAISGADTLVTTNLTQSITGVKTMTNPTTLAGTNSVPSMTITNGVNLTNAAANAIENDAIGMYLTTNTTDGRGHIPARQHFRLINDGSSFNTQANFFGTTSNIPLVASAYYYIEIVMWFTKTTSETVTIYLINSAAPTSQNIRWEQTPITGLVAPPGTAGLYLEGDIQGDATASKSVVTGSLTTAQKHRIRINIELKNGTGTKLQIQASCASANGITPLLGSYWTSTRIPTGNTGTFGS